MKEESESSGSDLEKHEKLEKQRLLDELAAKGDFKNVEKRASSVDDPEALMGLYRQSIGLPDYIVEESDADLLQSSTARPISKITHHEIQAMRTISSTESEPVAKAQHRVNKLIIRFWDSLVAALSPKKYDCTANGHECIHCGTHYKTSVGSADKQKVATS